MRNILRKTREKYFKEVAGLVSDFNGHFIVLTHLLPDRTELLEAISSIAPIAMIIAIPYSTDQEVLENLQQSYHVITPSLDQILDTSFLKKTISDLVKSKPTIILEIGGYFAKALAEINAQRHGNNLIGVIESTEAGHRQYEKVKDLVYPVISVARGSLKKTEYALVGTSCIFSIEQLFRDLNCIIDSKKTFVVGFGKVGRGLARSLLGRHCLVSVYDTDAIARILALSEGYRIPEKHEGLRDAEIILGATGNLSITAEDFPHIKNGSVLVSCSSKNNEFDLDYLNKHYQRFEIHKNVDLYANEHHQFYLLGKGTPINFLDSAVIGPVLALIQAEVIFAINSILQFKNNKGLFEVSEDSRQMLAQKWLKYFGNGFSDCGFY